jgi:hypothetical protein
MLVAGQRRYSFRVSDNANLTHQRLQLAALLRMAGVPHREVVASSVGLEHDLPPEVIAHAIKGDIRELVEGLPAEAMRSLMIASSDAVASRLLRGDQGWYRHLKQAEERGLAFAFAAQCGISFVVPLDICAEVRLAVARCLTAGIGDTSAPEWYAAAPGQCWRDAVALWSDLARSPVPLIFRGDGPRARSLRRLQRALEPLDVPDPTGTLAGDRVEVTLSSLRDAGYSRSGCKPSSRQLTDYLWATGDLAQRMMDEVALPLGETEVSNAAPGALGLVVHALKGRTVPYDEVVRVTALLCGWDTAADRRDRIRQSVVERMLNGEIAFGYDGEQLVALRFIDPETLSPKDIEVLQRRCVSVQALVVSHDQAGAEEEEQICGDFRYSELRRQRASEPWVWTIYDEAPQAELLSTIAPLAMQPSEAALPS